MYVGDIRRTAGMTDNARITRQIENGDVDASADAARKIAQRIEDDGGFWGPRKDAAS